MLENTVLSECLFIDIETVPGCHHLEQLSPSLQQLWYDKAGKKKADTVHADDYYFQNAGIFAEFGKIICISVGNFTHPDDKEKRRFYTKSIYGHSELDLLQSFSELIISLQEQRNLTTLIGHNIKEFDLPYICRRMLVHDLPLPDILSLQGKKPWEVTHIDTMQLWKFGDNKNYTSLNLLAALFDIPSPKDDIDGSQVARVYWKENDLDRIAAYCVKDVATVARLLLKWMRHPPLADAEIIERN